MPDLGKKENDNCLAGMQCPECRALEPFRISAKAEFIVWDDGADDFQCLEWSDDSMCSCRTCGYIGSAGDFNKKEDGDA